MFRPNLSGRLRSVVGRDVHGRATYGGWRVCPFAIVNLDLGALKTSVRADSSASRGAADEKVAQRAVILVGAGVSVKLNDLFTFEGNEFLVAGLHNRRSISGAIDHIQVALELLK